MNFYDNLRCPDCWSQAMAGIQAPQSAMPVPEIPKLPQVDAFGAALGSQVGELRGDRFLLRKLRMGQLSPSNREFWIILVLIYLGVVKK